MVYEQFSVNYSLCLRSHQHFFIWYYEGTFQVISFLLNCYVHKFCVILMDNCSLPSVWTLSKGNKNFFRFLVNLIKLSINPHSTSVAATQFKIFIQNLKCMPCCSNFFSQLKSALFDDGPTSNAISNKLDDEYTSFYFSDVIKCKLLCEFYNWSFIVLKLCFLKGNQSI